MKVWKKFSAIALTLVMALALCAPAFAASATFGDMKSDTDDSSEDGLLGEFTEVGAPTENYSDKYVLLYKEITAYNSADNTTVKAPTITYNYAVTAGTASTDATPVTITDEFNIPVGVKAGITTNVAISGAVSKTTGENPAWSYATGSLAFTPSVELTASTEGTKNAFPIKVDFSTVVFTGAGVYRYVITETVTHPTGISTDADAKTNAGIVDGSITNVRYLDVYVKDAESVNDTTPAKDKYEIYGFVCFQNLDNIDGTLNDDEEASETNNLSKIAKTDGFVAADGWDSTKSSGAEVVSLTADAYYTYNVTISKTLESDQAMLAHQFPFSVAFANTNVTANVLPIVTSSGTATAPNLTAGNINSFTVDGTNATAANQLKIADSGSVTFTGIPAGTTLTIDEQNDVAGTTYSVATTGGDSDETAGTDTNYNDVTVTSGWAAASNNDEAVTVTLAAKADGADMTADAAVTVAFTNTMVLISPTGVALRYAPYLAMMGAGIVALPLSLRKKEELF